MVKISNTHHRTKDGLVKKNPKKPLSKLHRLALDIESFIRKHELSSDLCIYFQGNKWCYDSYGKKTISKGKASNSFEWANDKTLSMTFEGPFYDVMEGYHGIELEQKFSKLLQKYGYYYERGNAWNLTLFEV